MSNFYAIYNPITLDIESIYPSHAVNDAQYALAITNELAISIFDGITQLSDCFVDTTTCPYTVTQQQIIKSLDDILHRIPDSRFVNIIDPNILVEVNSTTNKITISCSNSIKQIKWANETALKFIICAYNDPHEIYQIITTTLSSLINESYVTTYTGNKLPFSIFTLRAFKTYLVTIT